MRISLAILIIAVTVAVAVPAFADLQNVVVGGSVRIRADWFNYGDNANDNAFVEQRTRLNVRADFTDAVSAFIELDDYEVWGGGANFVPDAEAAALGTVPDHLNMPAGQWVSVPTDFRSDYLSGVDGRASTGDNVGLYQAYIEANEMWGTKLKARIGRQEIKLGSGWLVGPNDKNAFFRGLSFDGVRLTYATDQFSAEALWAKLAEQSPLRSDGDVDLYGVYASYLGIENVTLDAYWLFVRDAKNVTKGSRDTHTVGLRGAGTLGAFDFEAEGAYQWLDLDDGNSDAWAGNLEVGYTFDMDYTPRVFLAGAYFDGSDKDEPFNRLFSNWEYTMFDFGLLNGKDDFGNDQSFANLTNFWTVRGGVSVMPTESLKVALAGGFYQLVDENGEPLSKAAGADKAAAAANGKPPVVTAKKEKDLGWELDASVNYAYTKDLSFEVGYAHFFTGDALGTDSDDFNYFYGETKLSF